MGGINAIDSYMTPKDSTYSPYFQAPCARHRPRKPRRRIIYSFLRRTGISAPRHLAVSAKNSYFCGKIYNQTERIMIQRLLAFVKIYLLAVALFIGGFAVLRIWKVNPIWVMVGTGAAGILLYALV